MTRGRVMSVCPDLVVVEEHGTVYLIPRLRPPVRLNTSASFLWNQLAGGVDVEGAGRAYAAHFGCEAAAAQSEVAAFVETVQAAGLGAFAPQE